MDKQIQKMLAIVDAQKYMENLSKDALKPLVILERLRLLRKRNLVGKMDYLEEDQKISATEINRIKRKLFIYKIKSIIGCELCGEHDVRCLAFHHKEKDEKNFSISQKIFWKSISILSFEINKCLIVCSNCHCKIHNPDICLP